MPELKTIDAHTHVQMADYREDRGAVIKRALDLGIGMINAGADEASSREAVSLAEMYEGMWATAGMHPEECEKPFPEDTMRTLAQHPKVVGIGECGLDYFRMDAAREAEIKHAQKELFEKHIGLSSEYKKPLVIHVREAFGDVLDMLHFHKNDLLPDPGIIHFFTGTADDVRKLLDLNFSFTFGGLVTFNREFDEVIRYIPADHVLVETDAPWVSPKSHRGQRNEPAYILETVAMLSELKACDPSGFLQNTERVFGLRV